ncbi:MAG: hypothetical protein H6Q74_3204 [Firmicutes bacterium]|nr:hypothetical protein [Bacillota bacterium]
MNVAKADLMNGMAYPLFSSSVTKAYAFTGYRGSLSIYKY